MDEMDEMNHADVDWDRTVFVLLAPDALARGLGEAVLDRLDALGYRPVAWHVLWQRPLELDAFHEKNITHSWKAYLYRLVDQLFAFGPTVAMLVHDERPGDADRPDSHQRLRQAKGASEPAEAGPGTIRGDLRSINAMLALMHSADCAADSRHESAVFLDRDRFHTDPGGLRTALRLLTLAGPPERRGYPEVLAGLRARVLAAAWDELAPAARAELAAPAEVADGLTEPGAGERLAALLPVGHPLASVLCADFTPECPGPALDRVRPLLRVHATDLDPWEDLVLATSRRFEPRRTSAR
jgi:nucleoside diphosphate kinase